jgi:hypothetical protein
MHRPMSIKKLINQNTNNHKQTRGSRNIPVGIGIAQTVGVTPNGLRATMDRDMKQVNSGKLRSLRAFVSSTASSQFFN